MTKEEVFKKIGNVEFMNRDDWLIHCLSSLGMLKLDEPPIDRAYDFASEALEGHALYCKSEDLKSILDRAGLKIVEK